MSGDKGQALPGHLKSAIEGLSGVDFSDVKVHYNSSKPANINAHAYSTGSQIYIAEGQEQLLAHEAWHVVQQKQGRVKPAVTTSEAGQASYENNVYHHRPIDGNVMIVADKDLEQEAQLMASRLPKV